MLAKGNRRGGREGEVYRYRRPSPNTRSLEPRTDDWRRSGVFLPCCLIVLVLVGVFVLLDGNEGEVKFTVHDVPFNWHVEATD
jgi:hypothetical protein